MLAPKRILTSLILSPTLVALLMLVATPNAYADVELGSPFSDNMVLQRGMKVPVWGWATPGGKYSAHNGNKIGSWKMNDKTY